MSRPRIQDSRVRIPVAALDFTTTFSSVKRFICYPICKIIGKKCHWRKQEKKNITENNLCSLLYGCNVWCNCCKKYKPNYNSLM